MELAEFLDYMNSGGVVEGGSELHKMMIELSQEALKITADLNGRYNTPEEVRALFSKLTGKQVDETFAMFPPFYTDCGKNIDVGINVFINTGCKFQDQGGISIGNGSLIGHNGVFQGSCRLSI